MIVSDSTLIAADSLNIVIILAFLCSVVFVVGYTARAPWWRYRVGRAMVSLDAAISVTLLPGILRLVFDVDVNGTFYNWYRVVSLFVVACTTIWRLYTVNYVQTHPEPGGSTEEDEVE